MKKLAAVLMAFVLVGSISIPARAVDLINPQNPYGMDGVGINVVDNWINNGHQASLVAGSTTQNGTDWQICNQLSDCDFSKFKMVTANLLLPNCESPTQTDCLESIEFKIGETWVAAKSAGNSGGPQVAKTTSMNLPAGGGVGLWSVDLGGQVGLLKVASHVDLEFDFDQANLKFIPKSLAVTVLPYLSKVGNFREIQHSLFVAPDKATRIQTTGFPQECAWANASECGQMIEFPKDVEIKTKLRIPSALGGWLMGRVSNPLIENSQIDNQNGNLTVSGAAVAVPKIFIAVPKSQGAEAMRLAFSNWNDTNGSVHNVLANQPNFGVIDAFRNLAKDSSIGDYSVWSFKTVSQRGRCFDGTSGVLGFVSTNASVYQGTAPEYRDGFLNYKVAGYHYGSDMKTPNIGTYDLVMRSSLARCLYGFSGIPTSAVVSVSGEGEAQNIATTLVNSDSEWLRLKASGFTYSQKNIQVKITAPGAVKKTTITCVKGKLTKKLSGIAPKCPTGYKKR
jgi:hypothetical protein